ncbi:MAG: glycoside hydrolase family 125 protein [Candidatus Eremiobacteraeota bacterium]|nr:glycoside hydrolase family 125 protein [Candidatus Eremiobacteraeota bacterium]
MNADTQSRMLALRRLAFVAAVALALRGGATPAAAAQTTTLAARLETIYLTAYDEAINRHTVAARDGTTYVWTGDIEAEWLRDASAVVEPYIGASLSDPQLTRKLRGVVARQAHYILIDPYANAFSRDYHVVERKFEVDSLLYPIWFASRYWRETGDRSIFTGTVNRAFERVLATLRDEQRHGKRSHYRNAQLTDGGRGSPTRYTGMVWTGFRPSDDPCRYHFNIPVNMFAVVVMHELTDIERSIYRNERDAENAWGLGLQIQRGIEQYGTLQLRPFGKIYAYEVDGLGHANVMDDANIPSLISIPYFGYVGFEDRVYRATRDFALSDRNPYYFVGKYARGVGSPHTPRGYVWPLALVMQALTSTDPAEIARLLRYLASSDTGDHRLHESFDANWPERFTRDDFAWPNALYAELVHSRAGGGSETALSRAADFPAP